MNLFVADPDWGWWIVWYFYLGGIAAGAYFLATLIEFAGRVEDRPLARVGYRLAFPLVGVCGVLLIVDLERPERFGHMLLQSERVHEALDEGWPFSGGWPAMSQALMLKSWSPMSIGAWALMLFGLFSFMSFLGSWWPQGRLARVLERGWLGRVFQLAGCGVGFFVASYTGVLLSATNQPLWSVTDWLGPLFLTSAASTGIAAVLLLGQWRGAADESRERLERADLWALGLELGVFVVFLASLGGVLVLVLQTWRGIFLVAGTLTLGLLLPLGLHLLPGRANWRVVSAAACALLGGFVLRYAVVMTPPEMLARRHSWSGEVPALSETWAGLALVAGAVLLAGLVPAVLRLRLGASLGQAAMAGAAALVIVAMTLWQVLATPAGQPPGPLLTGFSPEDGRERGGGVGASALNRPDSMPARTKVKGMEQP
ncbi:MAG: polysulfide reductase NrfD [Gemmataceae bacterium]|nr:polysulfide reductase NrfD [Gemmataceae bacterium]